MLERKEKPARTLIPDYFNIILHLPVKALKTHFDITLSFHP